MSIAILIKSLKTSFPDHSVCQSCGGEVTLAIGVDNLLEVAAFLKDQNHLKFNLLVDIVGVDYPSNKNRFEVIYLFLSMEYQWRLALKISVGEQQGVESLCSLFPSANWAEREVWDMYGVPFYNHPDLRKILTDYTFEGYPLRKDFPLTGHTEVCYDKEQERVVSEPVHLPQAYRNFDFESPWQAMQNLAQDTEIRGKGNDSPTS